MDDEEGDWESGEEGEDFDDDILEGGGLGAGGDDWREDGLASPGGGAGGDLDHDHGHPWEGAAEAWRWGGALGSMPARPPRPLARVYPAAAVRHVAAFLCTSRQFHWTCGLRAPLVLSRLRPRASLPRAHASKCGVPVANPPPTRRQPGRWRGTKTRARGGAAAVHRRWRRGSSWPRPGAREASSTTQAASSAAGCCMRGGAARAGAPTTRAAMANTTRRRRMTRMSGARAPGRTPPRPCRVGGRACVGGGWRCAGTML